MKNGFWGFPGFLIRIRRNKVIFFINRSVFFYSGAPHLEGCANDLLGCAFKKKQGLSSKQR
jgi:hypothetical protein